MEFSCSTYNLKWNLSDDLIRQKMNDVDKEDAEISNRCIYLIDQKVYFIPDENVLISKNYDEKIKLLSTATECLSTLISRQGQIIPREELMDSIWKKRGVIASDNNFYQTILTIRKAFSTLGLDDVIATRYRRGLVIEKNLNYFKDTAFIRQCRDKNSAVGRYDRWGGLPGYSARYHWVPNQQSPPVKEKRFLCYFIINPHPWLHNRTHFKYKFG